MSKGNTTENDMVRNRCMKTLPGASHTAGKVRIVANVWSSSCWLLTV